MLKTKVLHNDEVIAGSFADLGKRHTTVWVDIADPDLSDLEMVAAHIGVQGEELFELLHPNQRPVLQDIGKFTAVVFHAPEIQKGTIIQRPHLLLASKEQQDFISVHQGFSQAVEKIAAYPMRRQVGIFQRGSTALLLAILSEIMADGFALLDYIGEEIGKLEEQVFVPKLSAQVMKRTFDLKKILIYFQRSLTADREVVSEIEKAYGQFLDIKQLSNFRSLYSDVTQLIELSTTYRDIIISAIEVHLSAISNNLNVVMKKLTAWAAIILVPSLIAGVYGMNFAFLPLAQHPAGFWYMAGAMLLSVWLLYSYFRHNDWL